MMASDGTVAVVMLKIEVARCREARADNFAQGAELTEAPSSFARCLRSDKSFKESVLDGGPKMYE